MANILCTGIATLDIVNEVAGFPGEDDEIRILTQEKRRGGNASNTAVILSQLGHQCSWAGTLVNEADNQIILEDLKQHRINYDHCRFLVSGKVPTSYIILSRNTGSRTICHYRDLPEYSFQDFKKINLASFDWLHFEGRNIAQTLQMLAYSKQQLPGLPISIEIEKPRKNIEKLIHSADIILFSRQYALTQGFCNAEKFCQHKNLQYPDKTVICAWGDTGAAAAINQQTYWQDAMSINAVDTLAAGDVFNAAIIDQQIKHQDIKTSLARACSLAGTKCTRQGISVL